MKKYLVLLVLFSGLFLSCSEEFELNAPGKKEVYVLNCILKNDSDIQIATITKSFVTENGKYPETKVIVPHIAGADVRLYSNSQEFKMRDTNIVANIEGKDTVISCYYVKNMNLIQNTTVRIEAVLPDGTKLRSETYIADAYFLFTLRFPPVFNSAYKPIISLSWTWTYGINLLTYVELKILYKQLQAGKWNDKEINIPLYFPAYSDSKGEHYMPISYFENNLTTAFATMDKINETMKEISGNDPFKKNYKINRILFYVYAMDSFMSRYHYKFNTSVNDYTVKLFPTQITNIKGGKGLLGVFYKYKPAFEIDSLYVESFGYQYKPTK